MQAAAESPRRRQCRQRLADAAEETYDRTGAQAVARLRRGLPVALRAERYLHRQQMIRGEAGILLRTHVRCLQSP